jgi:hypothetical protein
MRQRGYLIAFVLVLLIACVGGFVGGRFLVRRLQQDFGSQTTWAPPTLPAPSQTRGATPGAAANARPTSSPSRSAPPVLAAPIPTRLLVTVPAPARAETPASDAASPEPTPTEIETATPSPSPEAVFPFLLARPVRHSTGDCPGSPQAYILGLVTDRSGAPLPDVRLRLVDEFGNEEFKVTKGGADAGRYDFPIFGPPRHFFLSVVDGSTRPNSPRVEIPHGVGADAQAQCHWVDWRRQ